MHLVIGSEKALLIDTGIGVGDLKAFVQTITDLPIVVVNTHGHPDHSAGNFQFDKVYMHENDFALADMFMNEDNILGTARRIAESNPEVANDILTEHENYTKPQLVPIDEGYVFDLGDRKLEVIWVPGHTMGSICLIDKANKQLFSGDNNNTHVWLFLDGCPPAEKYLESLEHLQSYAKDFNILFLGHGEPLDKEYLNEIHTCVENILDGNCESVPYENSISDKAMKCTYKRALVAFDPANLFYKKSE